MRIPITIMVEVYIVYENELDFHINVPWLKALTRAKP